MAFALEASRPLFWALPSMFLSRSAAAAGIALINSVGNLGGIIGPMAIGWAKDATQSFAGALYLSRSSPRLPRFSWWRQGHATSRSARLSDRQRSYRFNQN